MTHGFLGAGGALVAGALLTGLVQGAAVAAAGAISSAERLANDGTPAAQVALGIRHQMGDGVPPNSTEASKWYRLAAEHGDAEGLFRLGWLYEHGDGLPQDYERAVELYESAAEKEFAIAQLALGWLYLKGEHVVRDTRRALDWFERAANHGDRVAQLTLGVIYSGSYESVAPDLAAAARWFRRAAEQGVDIAQFRLGAMYAAGDGVPQNPREAYFWLSVAITNTTMPDGRFEAEAAATRTEMARQLSPDETREIEQRAADWKPGTVSK